MEPFLAEQSKGSHGILTCYDIDHLFTRAMAPVKNGRIVFNERPKGPMLKDQVIRTLLTISFRADSEYPEPGKTTIYDEPEIDFDTASLDGGVLIKTLVLSVDPYMRTAMRESAPLCCFFLCRSTDPTIDCTHRAGI